MSRLTRRWEDYAKAVMQEQDPEKLGYFVRQLNLALNENEKLALPPMRRKSDRCRSDKIHGEGRTNPSRTMLSEHDEFAQPPELAPDETGQVLEPGPVASLPYAGDTLLNRKESIMGRVVRLRLEVADIRRSNKEYLQLRPNQSAENGQSQRRSRLKQIIADLEGLRNRTVQLR